MRDRVTISLYSVEISDPPGYRQGFLGELSNIKKICEGLVAAVENSKERRPLPEFIVSVLLVPNWDRPDNSYTDGEYLKRKSAFLAEAKSKFESIDGLQVEDFYLNSLLLPEHKAYMHGLKAMGSNADMIKILAIINNANLRRHLQIDSNTIVPSFEELYNQTFNATEQKDGLNASYYDLDYVSAHNKMVYTTPEGGIARESRLDLHLSEWCEDHKNDNNTNGDKRPQKNSLYARVFTKALHACQYVREYADNENRIIYAATLDDKVYWLTDYMTTALNMSWSANQTSKHEHELKNLTSVQIGDSLFNFQCFINVIKKHTGDLSIHSMALGLEDSTLTGEKSREMLLEVSNNMLELNAVKAFYAYALQNHPQYVVELSEYFPNTPQGNILTMKVFGCTVEDLQASAKKIGELFLTSTADNTEESKEQATGYTQGSGRP